jgi:hypothetical protein
MKRFFSGPTAAGLRSVAAMSTILLVGLWARGAAAQTAEPAPPPPPLEARPAAAPPQFLITSPPSDPAPHDAAPDKPLVDARAIRGAKRLETAGVVLSLIGAGGMVAGGVMAGTADTSRARSDFAGFNILPGLITVGMSFTILATGVPLWIVGANRSPKSIFSAAPASLKVGSNGTGVWVSGSF